jgi:sarcosine oxidase subunit gamma
MSDANNQETPEATLVASMDQWPGSDIPARSPLAHQATTVPDTLSGTPGVYLWEEALCTHLVLRGDASLASFSKGVESATGLALPGTLQSNSANGWTLCWISPDEWLLIGPEDQAFAMETSLRSSLSGHVAVVNVSGGQTLVRLAGANARQVLMKSSPYDVHDVNFPVGKVVTTVLAKSQATIRRVSEDDWELVVRRSFADYVWRWLVDACSEFTVQKGQPGPASARGTQTQATASQG